MVPRRSNHQETVLKIRRKSLNTASYLHAQLAVSYLEIETLGITIGQLAALDDLRRLLFNILEKKTY